MSRDPRIRVRLPRPPIPTFYPIDLRPDSTYNIVIEVPETQTKMVMKLERPIRPGFLYAAVLSPKLKLKIGSDVARSPSSSYTVTATTP